MSEISLMITVTREQQVSVEEHCINSGLSISAYFMALHDQFQRFSKEPLSNSRKWVSKEEAKELFPEPEKEESEQIEEEDAPKPPSKKKHSK